VPGVRTDGPFPRASLRDLDGRLHPLEETWKDGGALVLIGHRNCKTTRETIPYVDRIHRRRTRGRVLLLLQDEPDTARALASDLKLDVPILLEEDPYPVAAALDLVAVPTLFELDGEGRIVKVVEAFNRAELEGFAERLGVPPPLFVPEDKAPAFKPG
jgi:hypothetical protein